MHLVLSLRGDMQVFGEVLVGKSINLDAEAADTTTMARLKSRIGEVPHLSSSG